MVVSKVILGSLFIFIVSISPLRKIKVTDGEKPEFVYPYTSKRCSFNNSRILPLTSIHFVFYHTVLDLSKIMENFFSYIDLLYNALGINLLRF